MLSLGEIADLECLILTLQESLVQIYIQPKPSDAVILCSRVQDTISRYLTRLAAPGSSADGTPISIPEPEDAQG